jgi:hypothetical protein
MFVNEINAPDEGVLIITLGQGGSIAQLDPADFAEDLLKRMNLEHRKLPRRSFELKWNRCIAYTATDETYAPIDRIIEPTTYSGRWFESFDNSRFLRYIAETTFAVEHHSLVLEHIRVRTYNWVIDVASDEAPQVRELEIEYR